MYQYDDPSASSTMPSPAAVGNPGYFTDGSAAAGVPATILRADFMNAVMLELINIVNAAGITLDKTKTNQVITALQALFMTETTADARYAWLNGADAQIFKVANAAANDEAINLGQADARYAALAGLASQLFSAANGTTGNQVVNFSQVLGLGQTLQNVTASRANNTTYTNSTGKPIVVMVSGIPASGTNSTASINGTVVWEKSTSGSTSTSNDSTFLIVPAGAMYSVNFINGMTTWLELR